MSSVTVLKQHIRCITYLYIRKHQFATIIAKEQILKTPRAKSQLQNRRRLDFNQPHKSNKEQSITFNANNNTIDNIDTYGLPLEIQETISKYKVDNNALQIAEIERSTSYKTKEKKIHSNKLLTQRISIKGNTGYLLQQPRILNQIFAEFADKCTPFKIDVSKPHKYSVIISAANKSNITTIRQYIIKHVQNKIVSIKCSDKKCAVIGAGGLNLKMIKNECDIQYIWEDDTVPGLLHIYDRNMKNGYKACNMIQCILDRTSILSLPIGQYGLLIIDHAYWLDFIREHSNAFIVGLDLKPTELYKRKIKQIEELNENKNEEQYGLMKDIIENTMKSRLLISGDSEEITMNASQMLYEFLKDTQEIEIEKHEFAHILGKHKRIIYAIVNEVESKFIDGEQYKQYFESEQIEENECGDPFWLEGLRLSVFPIDEQYGNCSLWMHGPPFMRNALKYYINSVILDRRKFLFTHATSFWIKCLFEYKQECALMYEMLHKLFGVKMKLVETQKHVEIDSKCNEYQRLYDHETYLLLESESRDNKLNVNGIRKYLDDLVANSIKIGLGEYSYLFEENDLLDFWVSMANECNVSIIFDSENKQIFIIGLNINVKEYQNKLLQIIKEIRNKQLQSNQQEVASAVIDREYLELFCVSKLET